MAELDTTCTLSITAETLSAWRDKQVRATTAEELARHVPTCAACQRELTQFEMVAHALRRQRELVPGNRIWNDVQARIGGRRHPGIQGNSRALLSGISGVIIVVLLGFVFARVLGGLDKSTGPIATATTTIPATVTPSPLPTALGSPVTTPVNTITITQAWGPNAAKMTFTAPNDATHAFQATNITSDGTKLLGDKFTFSAPPVNNQGPSDAQSGFLDIATQGFTDIGVKPPTAGLFDRPSCCMTDGRFLVAEDSDAPGVTCGECHLRFWSYDLQTERPAQIVATSKQFQEIFTSAFDHETLILNTGTGIQLEDLTTLHITPMATPGGDLPGYIASFSWPYLVYSISNGSTSMLHIYDVATSSETLTLPNATDAVITGDTVFYTVQSTSSVSLFELDHFTTPGSKPHQLATYSTSNVKLLAANGRLVLIDDTDSGYYEAWDRAQGRFVQLATPPVQNSGVEISAALSGNLLIVMQASSAYGPQQVAIYDTTKLPQR